MVLPAKQKDLPPISIESILSIGSPVYNPEVAPVLRKVPPVRLVTTSWTFMYENSSLLVKATENGHGNHR